MFFLQNLRNKSDSEKRVITLFLVFVIMLGIFFLWLPQFKENMKVEVKLPLQEDESLHLIKENIDNSVETILDFRTIIEENLEEKPE